MLGGSHWGPGIPAPKLIIILYTIKCDGMRVGRDSGKDEAASVIYALQSMHARLCSHAGVTAPLSCLVIGE